METKSNGDNQPPRNKIEPSAHINNIFAYSPSQKSAYIMPEYSVWYPETNSASASGRSNGGLLVSAKAEIKKITKAKLILQICSFGYMPYVNLFNPNINKNPASSTTGAILLAVTKKSGI